MATFATRQTWKIPGAYDLKKHKLVTRKRQSGTEDYSKNNRTRRRTTQGRLGTRAASASQKPLPNTPVCRGALTELTVNGKVSEERSAAGSDSL